MWIEFKIRQYSCYKLLYIHSNENIYTMSFHLNAKPGDYAETVLLPGDPLRAKHMAYHFLDNVRCVNDVRGMYGYTGDYQGKLVSIQGSGMGMASSAIYIHELVTSYHVKNIIRVGTCGAIQPEIPIGQVILVMSASGDSSANRIYFDQMDYAPTASFELLHSAFIAAKKLDIPTIQGSIFSTDSFYFPEDENRWDKWASHGVLAAEMESQILFTLAARNKIRGLSIVTVSDNIITGAMARHEDREKSYTDMMKIALEIS